MVTQRSFDIEGLESRQVPLHNNGPFDEYEAVLDYVLLFPDVPRPGMPIKGFHCFRVHASNISHGTLAKIVAFLNLAKESSEPGAFEDEMVVAFLNGK